MSQDGASSVSAEDRDWYEFETLFVDGGENIRSLRVFERQRGVGIQT